MVPRSYYGGAWSADSRGSSTRSTTRPTGRSRCGGTGSAPPVADDVLVLEEPDERFELQRAGEPLRRPGGPLDARARDTTRGLAGRRRTTRQRHRASVGGRRDGVRVPRRAPRVPTAPGRADRGQRRRGRVPADAGPGAGRTARTRPAGPRPGPRTRPSGCAGRRVRRRGGAVARAGGGTRLRVLDHDDLAGPGRDLTAVPRRRRPRTSRARRTTTPRSIMVADESYAAPAGLERGRPAHRRADRGAPAARRPATTPTATSCERHGSRRADGTRCRRP